MKRLRLFLSLVWQENMANSRVSIRDAWALAGYLTEVRP